MSGREIGAFGLVACVVLLGACGSEKRAAEDCNPRVRFDEATYTYAGKQASGATGVRLGEGLLSHCLDVGRTTGDTFDGDPATVPVVKIENVDPSREIWIVQNGDRYRYERESESN